MAKNQVNLAPLSTLPVDWENIMVAVKNRLQDTLPVKWNDWVESNYGTMILEAIAYEIMLANYNLNASLNEVFLSTARTRDAIFRMAKSFGYKPYPSKSSIVVLRFSLDTEDTNADVIIPKYTICYTDSDVKFYTIEEAIIPKNTLYVDALASSGNLNLDTFVCNGVSGYKYKLLNNKVNEIISVTVDDLEYKLVDFIDIEDTNGLYYVAQYDKDYYGYISFGDGTYGINPGEKQIIKVLYSSGSDISSNVESNTINNVKDVIYNTNNAIKQVNVTNYEPAYGGANAESLKDIKRNIPTIFKTQQRIVTLEDSDDLLYAFGGISKIRTFDHTTVDNMGIFGVKICIIPESASQGNIYPSESYKQELMKYIDSKKIFATQPEIVSPSYIPFNVNINVTAYPTASIAVLNNQLYNAISFYLNWSNRELGDSVSKSDIYDIVSDIDGIAKIDDITISENRNLYLTEYPEIGSNMVKIRDNMNMITDGTILSFMDNDSVCTLVAKVIGIDGDKYYLINPVTNENIKITRDMQLSINTEVFPTLYLDIKTVVGDRKLYIKNSDIVTSINSKRNMILNDLNNATIYFNNNPNTTYQILFRIGDTMYLDRPLEEEYIKDSPIYIKYKKMVPVLQDSHVKGTNVLNITEYPRFDVGTYLIKKEDVKFTSAVLTLQRSSKGIDRIIDYMNLDEFVAIEKIYKDLNNVLIIDEDYTLNQEGNEIIWTDQGKLKVKENTQYFVDVTKKDLDVETTKYYVSDINKKLVTISPRLKEDLYDGQVFSYTAETFRLMPWEIADVGTISIHINKA